MGQGNGVLPGAGLGDRGCRGCVASSPQFRSSSTASCPGPLGFGPLCSSRTSSGAPSPKMVPILPSALPSRLYGSFLLPNCILMFILKCNPPEHVYLCWGLSGPPSCGPSRGLYAHPVPGSQADCNNADKS